MEMNFWYMQYPKIGMVLYCTVLYGIVGRLIFDLENGTEPYRKHLCIDLYGTVWYGDKFLGLSTVRCRAKKIRVRMKTKIYPFLHNSFILENIPNKYS